MKRRTNAQKYGDYADAYKAIKEGKPVKRSRSKDGSIVTHPVVPVPAGVPEKFVLEKCLTWLKKKQIFCNRNNVGAGQMADRSGYYVYGIKDGGDLIGLLPDGRHFEIEAKRSNGGRLSLGQQKRMLKIRENNGLYFVVHGIKELEFYMGPYL